MDALADWWTSGERIEIRDRDGSTHRVFVREAGDGPTVTLLHGFPSSSWDYARLVGRLEDVRWLALDHLGFGESDKPDGHAYSLFEQLAILEQVWAARDVDRTWVIAHDYSVSVVQEALAQMAEGGWTGPAVEAVTLLNGGLFYSAIERKLVQDVLRAPVLGPLAARLLPRALFLREFGDVFADGHRPPESELVDHWRAITNREGRPAIARVARYLDERREHEERWTMALVDPPVPVRYVWGLEDPISGTSILGALRERVPDPDVVELDGVAHYPQIEAPDEVYAAALLPSP